MSETQSPGKARRIRSPGYPSIGLERAVSFAVKFYRKERREPVNRKVAATAFGYGMESQVGQRAVSALMKYGLLDKHKQDVRLTERALDIVLAQDPSDEKRLAALREAIRAPSIHRELLDRWDRLPSDDSIRYYLLRERGFNEQAVDSFISQLRNSIAYAGAGAEEPVAEETSEEEVEPEVTGNLGEEQKAVVNVHEMPHGGAGLPTPRSSGQNPSFRADLPDGNVIEIKMAHKVSSKTFEDIVRKLFEVSEFSFVEDWKDDMAKGES